MFEQAAIAVRDEQGYAQLHALIDAAFDSRDVEVFLNRVSKAKLRIRDYEGDFEARVAGQTGCRALRGAAGFRSGPDAGAVFAAGGSGAAGAAAEVLEGLRVLLRCSNASEVEVKIDGLPLVSSEEWAKAQHAPEKELPHVDPDRYIASRRLGLPFVADARREYAWELARQRMQSQGQALAAKAWRVFRVSASLCCVGWFAPGMDCGAG